MLQSEATQGPQLGGGGGVWEAKGRAPLSNHQAAGAPQAAELGLLPLVCCLPGTVWPLISFLPPSLRE